MKRRRYSFEQKTKHHPTSLRMACDSLMRRVCNEKMTQREFMEARSVLFNSEPYMTCSERAQQDAWMYLRGAIQMLFASNDIVWRHRDAVSGDFSWATWNDKCQHYNSSNFVWLGTNIEYFERGADASNTHEIPSENRD